MSKHPKTMTTRIWQGVRMRRVAAAADPDSLPRMVTMPAAWDDREAAALAALVPGNGAVTLTAAADVWIAPIAERARRARDRAADQADADQRQAVEEDRRSHHGRPMKSLSAATTSWLASSVPTLSRNALGNL